MGLTELHGGVGGGGLSERRGQRGERTRGRRRGGGMTARAGRRPCTGRSDEASTAASRGAAWRFLHGRWVARFGDPLRGGERRSRWASNGGAPARDAAASPANLTVSPPRVRPTRRYNHRVSTSPWPSLHDEDRWLLAAMEDQLRDSTQSPEQLQARARELRAQAEQSDIKGVRDASLALAGHYEEAAAARLAAR